uniref:Uncharacterized protein n=1 Tax=Arundo donax TaxID=35708 RepID=A0A0A9BDB0_ARUDO
MRVPTYAYIKLLFNNIVHVYGDLNLINYYWLMWKEGN